MNIGPTFADPLARMLYAEIASIEEQHVTHYESMMDPTETWMEQWLLHEATEVWNYWSCSRSETNPRIKHIWERFLDYELGHLQIVMDLFKQVEKRDPAELLPKELPEPIAYQSHRDFVRRVLQADADLRAAGPQFIRAAAGEPERTVDYRAQLNGDGSPSQIAATDYTWTPGSELMARARARVEAEVEEGGVH
jgi:hypothetical protein